MISDMKRHKLVLLCWNNMTMTLYYNRSTLKQMGSKFENYLLLLGFWIILFVPVFVINLSFPY